MYLSFAHSFWCLLLVLYSITALHYWIKLAVGQWYHKSDYTAEQAQKALERESYNKAIGQLKEIHEQLSKFLQRANESYYKDMKKVMPGVWIHKDFPNFTAALKWLNSVIDLPVYDVVPKNSVTPPTPNASTHFHPEAIRLMRLRHKYENLMRFYGLHSRQDIKEMIDELWSIEMELYNQK